jgi:hypothetical protein
MWLENILSLRHLANTASRWASENLNVLSVNNSMSYDEILGENDIAICKDSFEGAEIDANASKYCFNLYYNNYNHHLVNDFSHVGESLDIFDLKDERLFPVLSNGSNLENLIKNGFEMSYKTKMEETRLVQLLLLNIKEPGTSFYYYSENQLTSLNSDELQEALYRFQDNNSIQRSSNDRVSPETLEALLSKAGIDFLQTSPTTEQAIELTDSGLSEFSALALLYQNPIFSDKIELRNMLTHNINLNDGYHMEATRIVQTILKTKGYYHGTITSISNPELLKAVRAFQTEKNIQSATGQINTETWTALFEVAGLPVETFIASQ